MNAWRVPYEAHTSVVGYASEGSALEACGVATGFSPWGLHFSLLKCVKKVMRQACYFCNTDYGQRDPLSDKGGAHGLCPVHYETELKRVKLPGHPVRTGQARRTSRTHSGEPKASK
jgi:hypothetical protein